MHALELAKTAWNSVIAQEVDPKSARSAPMQRDTEERVRHYLVLARRVLECYGSEGDEGGPLAEIAVLAGLLDD